MENQPLLDGPAPDPLRRKNGDNHVLARQQYIEVPPSQLLEEPGPGLLLEYWDILRRHKGTLILIAFLGLLTSILLTLPQTPIYQARASLEIQSINEDFLNMREMSPTANGGGSYPPQYDLQTQAKILQSESVLNRVIAKLHLEEKLLQEKDRGRLAAWRNALGLSPWKSDSPREEVLRLVTKNLKVSTEASTRLVEIQYDSKDPQLAADFLNALTTEFIQQNIEARWKTTQQTGDWLTHQMEDVRIKLEKSEDELQSYAHATGLLFTSEKVGTQLIEGNVAEDKLRQLQEELSKAHGERVSKQSVYELVSSAPPESLPEVLDDKTLEDYQVKLTDLRRQLAELSAALTPAHPAVKKVQAQVSSLELALGTERAAVVQRIRNEYQSAYRRENLLTANYASQARLVSEQAAEVAHYNILKSDVDTNRQLYDSMLHNVQEAGMTSALRASNIRVVDSAIPPTRPYKPRMVLNAALGLLAGALFGFVFVVMRERADRSIQAPGEAALSLGVPELGVIPSLDAERSRYFAYYRDSGHGTRDSEGKNGSGNGRRLMWKHRDDSACVKPGAGSGTLTLGLATGESGDHHRPPNTDRRPPVELVTSQLRPSALAECFRATATSILYAGENGDRPRVIVLTSANPAEGKTTVASNLALAFAEFGRRVLLIDGDLRKGRLHEVFQVSNAWGFSDLLEGKALPPGREQAFVGTGYQRLSLLPAGSAAASISNLLHSPRTSEFLSRMREEFHTVIIDTPPMLQMADARILGKVADAVVLVVRSAQTTRDEASTAVLRLAEDGTRVLGSILNEWDPRKTSHTGYAAGYRHYQYEASRG
jgi:capsular exopolysaccharide synthesis family protein